MVCDMRRREETEEERQTRMDRALSSLEQALDQGTAQLNIGPSGAVAFEGWSTRDRNGVSDTCAYLKLSAAGSWALRQAQASAEAIQGRTVNIGEVKAGVHSHGGTWHKGH